MALKLPRLLLQRDNHRAIYTMRHGIKIASIAPLQKINRFLVEQTEYYKTSDYEQTR